MPEIVAVEMRDIIGRNLDHFGRFTRILPASSDGMAIALGCASNPILLGALHRFLLCRVLQIMLFQLAQMVVLPRGCAK